MEYNTIMTPQDIEQFIERVNWLHDGYLISLSYRNKGIENLPCKYLFDRTRTCLTMRILVTSIWDQVVELVFEDLLEWNIKEDRSAIQEISVFFHEGYLVWVDTEADTYVQCAGCSYVVARIMKWRIEEKDDENST